MACGPGPGPIGEGTAASRPEVVAGGGAQIGVSKRRFRRTDPGQMTGRGERIWMWMWMWMWMWTWMWISISISISIAI